MSLSLKICKESSSSRYQKAKLSEQETLNGKKYIISKGSENGRISAFQADHPGSNPGGRILNQFRLVPCTKESL